MRIPRFRSSSAIHASCRPCTFRQRIDDRNKIEEPVGEVEGHDAAGFQVAQVDVHRFGL